MQKKELSILPETPQYFFNFQYFIFFFFQFYLIKFFSYFYLHFNFLSYSLNLNLFKPFKKSKFPIFLHTYYISTINIFFKSINRLYIINFYFLKKQNYLLLFIRFFFLRKRKLDIYKNIKVQSYFYTYCSLYKEYILRKFLIF